MGHGAVGVDLPDVKVGDDWAIVRSYGATYDILISMADTAIDQYREFLRAWSSQDLDLADHLARSGPVLDLARLDGLERLVASWDRPELLVIDNRSCLAGMGLVWNLRRRKMQSGRA